MRVWAALDQEADDESFGIDNAMIQHIRVYESRACSGDDCRVSVGCGKGEVPTACKAVVANGGTSAVSGSII